MHREPQHMGAMLCGIAVFILVYTILECTQVYHRVMRQPFVYRTVLIGYGTRVVISILFPIGLIFYQGLFFRALRNRNRGGATQWKGRDVG